MSQLRGQGRPGSRRRYMLRQRGLKTIVLEPLAPGGQAGTSSKIENYLGFPTGISGQALAGRAHIQAQKFGARISVSRAAVALDCSEQPFRLTLEDGQTLRARSIIVATGARYRRLEVPGSDRFEGQGIHYAATAMEAGYAKRKHCRRRRRQFRRSGGLVSVTNGTARPHAGAAGHRSNDVGLPRAAD